jgi:hypothetical protein
MTILKDLTDEWTELANGRMRWETYWRNVAAWVLPQTEQYDRVVSLGAQSSVQAVMGAPAASERSKYIYDMTSIWAIDRLTAGLISLKTPESDYWHDLSVDDDYGYEQTHDEDVALEKLRDYLFKVRSNPKSGFWPNHKASVKSMCAFGDGWHFIEELQGGRIPYQYQNIPLFECYPSVNAAGQPDRMFRVFSWSALQIYQKWGEKAGPKIKTMVDDPKRMHERVRILHAVRPRGDEYRNKLGLRGAKFASWYCLPDDDHVIGEGGFWEFPFTRYAWSNIGQRPYSEGPVAYAIAEIMSLQEMSKNELIAVQTMLRPAYGTFGKNFTRLNFNPGATNPGLINGDGNPLFAPLNSGVRPDFAQSVIESRRNNVREALYLNLWQILVQDNMSQPETATEAMLRAQEKGEMLGPVGISMNEGLSQNIDREVSILARKGAFAAGSPLAMPESMADQEVSPQFTSPLDRLRQVGQLVGAQRMVEFAALLVANGMDPAIAGRIDGDELLELAQRVLGAPVKSLRDRDVSKQGRQQQAQMADTATAIQGAQGTGDAMRALGEGAQAAAGGAEALRGSPAIASLMQQIGQSQTRTAA